MKHPTQSASEMPAYSRRKFLQDCALALASTSVLGSRSFGETAAPKNGPASRIIPMDGDWLFGGKFTDGSAAPAFADGSFTPVTLPHSVANLSWRKWDPKAWQDVWIYRRHFKFSNELRDMRTFVHFDAVSVGATPTINGHELPQHLGSYLPSRYEITDWLTDDNVLAVAVDSRWINVPPDGSPVGTRRVDYLEVGGITRSVRLEVVPHVFISDVFAKPLEVLTPGRRVEIACTIDAGLLPSAPVSVGVELRDGKRVVSRTEQLVVLEKPGQTVVNLTLANLGDVALWHVDSPKLYDVVTTLSLAGAPLHDHRVRIGFREARFELDGFYLNGQRLQLFGLNRHEIFPYVGGAMPKRVMRRDAEMIKRDYNCNAVRCSHYPQSEAFLDMCDELGLMVWEETPGWGYLGDAPWKELVVQNVHDMVIRDRNHPAIVIWGVRVNESDNDEPLYRRTTELAKTLDGTRPTSGSMTSGSRKTWKEKWHQDVFAYDDYHADPDGTVGIEEPTPGYPYMLAEAVGQFNYTARKGFDIKYRRSGDLFVQQQQAVRHAQAHSKAASFARCCGVIAWCAYDYSSLVNPYENVKCPGIADSFRIPKLGASFYLAQVDPKVRPVIAPSFYWDFGPHSPTGPGKNVAIFSNCDRLELFVDGKPHATLLPDAKNYPHLKHPPSFVDLEFVDLEFAAGARPELRIDGYLGGTLALTRSFSSDSSQDQLVVAADDSRLHGDGADSTRVTFKAVDKFGADRAYAGGQVSLSLSGPGVIVGDNPFAFEDAGGVGGVWVRTNPHGKGRIEIQVTHSTLGAKSVAIEVG